MHSDDVVRIAYGKGSIPLRIDPARARWHIVVPRHVPALRNPKEHFQAGCAKPIGSPPLSEIIRPNDRVVITTSDGTRPVPNRLLLPWLLDRLPVAPENVTLVIGTGSHRPNTPEELENMLGAEVLRRVRVVNHDAYDPAGNIRVGESAAGHPVSLNRLYAEADKRVAAGFIEPHFFAGFSGGPKAVAPGLASIETILGLHRYGLVADPRSTWGVLEENPMHAAIREAAACCPPDFLVNVTLNAEKEITGIFCGDYLEAHRAGCGRAAADAMAAAPALCPLVITSNSGFPLDQNLYQTVKGISAAARVCSEGGRIVVASECADGVPDHGNFARLMAQTKTPQALLAWLKAQPAPILDQWQAQVLADILQRCCVSIYSSLPARDAERCMLLPLSNLQACVDAELAALGNGVDVAVLPHGPITIPFVEA
ncbi:MAG TPA: nickel-dependent lactate racemase [Candidatus Hydrogenedentes bacterium]|nr:nickel-dependent lactate racemase [Candidatus Hydrogenedentota bacterium]